MYVTQHAIMQMVERLGVASADALSTSLEHMSGQVGRVAYLLADLPYVADEGGSRGDVLVAIAIEGSVETVYFRRRDQDMSADWFGVDVVIDLRFPDTCGGPQVRDVHPMNRGPYGVMYDEDAPYAVHDSDYEDEGSQWDDTQRALPPIKGEARAKRLDSREKMVVSNRSALMLNRLVRDAGNRKRQRRRKRGGK